MQQSQKDIIEARKKALKLRQIKQSPQLSSAIRSLVSKEPKRSNRQPHKPISGLPGFTSISQSIIDTKKRSEYISKLFPDMELSMQILISSIISPKDMTSNEIHLTSTIDYLPSDVLGTIVKTIKSYLDQYYELNDDVPDIIRRVLFETGSDVKVILPDYVITSIVEKTTNLSMETIDRIDTHTVGFIRPTVSTFQLDQKQTISVSILDNFEVLSKPILLEHYRKQSVYRQLGINLSLESTIDIDALYAPVVTKHPYIEVTYLDNHIPKTRPLVMSIPSEATIPVYHIGNPKDHLGYFILVDRNGYPVTSDYKVTEHHKPVYDYTKNNTVSTIHSKLYNDTNKGKQRPELIEIFKANIEKTIKESLKDSIYGSGVEFDPSEELYHLMLTRALEGSECRLLYLPKEMVSYIAIKYYPNGIGKSLLDDLQILLSIRAILLFSTIVNKVKSSIPITEVNLKLDEHDPDPDKTIETVMASVMATRQSYLPIWELNPADLVDWVHKAGVVFTFDGHPGLPDVKIDFNTSSLDHKVPDDDLIDDIRKQTIMALGLNPEIVDNSFNPDFATTVVANNILLAKRVKQLQRAFTSVLTDYVRKLIQFDGILRDEIRSILMDNYSTISTNLKSSTRIKFNSRRKEDIVNTIVADIVDSILVKFPDPDERDIENLSDAFDTYSQSLDTVLDSILSEDALPQELVGELSDRLDTLKQVFKHYYLRKWMAENNYYTELFDIVDKDNDQLLEMLTAYTANTSTNIIDLFRKVKSIQRRIERRLSKLTDETDDTQPDTDQTDTDTENTDEF